MLMQRFKREEFVRCDGARRAQLSAELAAALYERLSGAVEFHRGVGELVTELRALGHDLWSFDESDEMEVWAPNYVAPSGPGILVTFSTHSVQVAWSEN